MPSDGESILIQTSDDSNLRRNLTILEQLNSAQDGAQRASGGLVTKECVTCGEVLPMSSFYARNDTVDLRSRSCKSCIKGSRHKRPLTYRNSTGSHRAR